MKILLHTCCGPCTIYPLEKLKEAEHQVHAFFYNPNIHPYTEWEKRRGALLAFARSNDLPVIDAGDYDLEGYLREVVHREALRCRFCYGMRLRRTAQVARRGKFDAFSTTMLVSPYQKHELIKEIGLVVAEETGVPFFYEDFRSGYRRAVELSRSLGMYRQQYCGCIYSEKERFAHRSKQAERGKEK